jgi:hypothetical protein
MKQNAHIVHYFFVRKSNDSKIETLVTEEQVQALVEKKRKFLKKDG